MHDVAIVGAGPAGAWTAFVLARAGVRVALFDGSHPREKPCGGGVTGRALALVQPALARAVLHGVRVAAARFVDTATGFACAIATGPDDLIVVSRQQFDGELLSAAIAARAEFVASRVTRIARLDDQGGTRDGGDETERSHAMAGPSQTSPGFALTTAHGTQRARIVIGADGANSFVRRSLGTALPRAHLSIATGFFAHGASSREIALEFVADPPGYLWSFPRPDHLSIGICAQADAGVAASALRETAARWIRQSGLGAGAELEPYSWPIPSLPAAAWQQPLLGGPGWLLVGDAAGLVDPITREGIFFALQSGSGAAAAVLAAPAAPLPHYTASLRREILPELVRAAELKSGFFRPRFVRLALDAVAQSAAIRAVMADLIAGRQPYRRLEHRLLGTLELGLTWKLFSDRWRDSRRGRALAPLAD